MIFFPGPTPEAINQNEIFPINAIPEKSEIKVIAINSVSNKNALELFEKSKNDFFLFCSLKNRGKIFFFLNS